MITNNQRVGKFELDDNEGKLTFQKLTCFNKGKFTFAAVAKSSSTDKYLTLQAGTEKKTILIKSNSTNKLIEKVGRIEGSKIFWTTLIDLNLFENEKDLLIEEQILDDQNLDEKSVEITNLDDSVKLSQFIKPQMNKNKMGFRFIINDHDSKNRKYKVTYTTSIDSANDNESNYMSKTSIFNNNSEKFKEQLGYTFNSFTLEDEVQFKKNDQFEDLKKTDKDELLVLLFKYFQEYLRQTDSEKESTVKSKLSLKDGKVYNLPSMSKLEDFTNKSDDSKDTEVPVKSKINLENTKKQFNQIKDQNVKPKSLNNRHYVYHHNRSHYTDSDQEKEYRVSRGNRRHFTHRLPQAGERNEIYLCLLGCAILSTILLVHFLYKKNH